MVSVPFVYCIIICHLLQNVTASENIILRGLHKGFAGTLISVSHDRKYISEVCDTVYRLERDGLHIAEKAFSS